MEKTEAPKLIFKKEVELAEPMLLEGTGPENVSFNMIEYLKFKGDWWLVKLSIKKKSQLFAAIVLFVDQFGTIRYSKDNIFSVSEANSLILKNLVSEFIKLQK